MELDSVGTKTFCLSGTRTDMHYGSGIGSGTETKWNNKIQQAKNCANYGLDPGPDLDPETKLQVSSLIFYFILHTIKYTTIYYGVRYRWRPEFIVSDT
jgi:hypothetical protein